MHDNDLKQYIHMNHCLMIQEMIYKLLLHYELLNKEEEKKENDFILF
jgi:hypothetical protein